MNTSETVQLCTFKLGDLFLGVDVGHVQEVIRSQKMTHVPLSDDCVEGLINLRGQIVTAVNLRKRFMLDHNNDMDQKINVVIRTQSGVYSLLVDSIRDVIDVDQSIYEHPPATLPKDIRKLIKGVYKLEDELLLILNTEKAVQFGEPKHKNISPTPLENQLIEQNSSLIAS